MGFTVAFDYAAWIAEFPEFTYSAGPPPVGVPSARAAGFFARATILHANDGTGPVSTAAIQSSLLNLVVAHLAALSTRANGAPINPDTPPGRVSSATEGSVTATFDMGAPGTSIQMFWQQTRYGNEYWVATRVYRTMRYVPGPVRVFNRWPNGYGPGQV